MQVVDLNREDLKSRAQSQGRGKTVLIHTLPHWTGQPLPASCVFWCVAIELMLRKLNWVWAAANAGTKVSPGHYCCATRWEPVTKAGGSQWRHAVWISTELVRVWGFCLFVFLLGFFLHYTITFFFFFFKYKTMSSIVPTSMVTLHFLRPCSYLPRFPSYLPGLSRNFGNTSKSLNCSGETHKLGFKTK